MRLFSNQQIAFMQRLSGGCDKMVCSLTPCTALRELNKVTFPLRVRLTVFSSKDFNDHKALSGGPSCTDDTSLCVDRIGR